MDVKRSEQDGGEMTYEECDLLAQELRKVMNIIGIEECDSEEDAEKEEVGTAGKNNTVFSKVDNTAAGSIGHDCGFDIVEYAEEEEEDYSIIKTQVFSNKSVVKDTAEVSSIVEVEELPTKIGLVIIRNLPPTMTENEFYTAISPIPDYDLFFYVMAKDESELKSSRAYVNFICPDNIHPFYDTLNNSAFYDSNGYKYYAQVELAPFCNILKNNQDESHITYVGYMKRIKKKVNSKSKIKNKNINSRIVKNGETSSKVVSWLASIEKNSEAHVSIENIVKPKNEICSENFDGKKMKGIENTVRFEDAKEKKFFFYRKDDLSKKDDQRSKRVQTRKISSDEKLGTQYLKGKNIMEKENPKISCQKVFLEITLPAEERSKTEIFPAQTLSKAQNLKGKNIGVEKENPKKYSWLQEAHEGRLVEEQSKTKISTENKMTRPLPTIEEVDVKIDCGKVDVKIVSEKSILNDASPQCNESKDPAPRIRYRDRPSMELYRPGKGRLTKKNTHHPSSTSSSFK